MKIRQNVPSLAEGSTPDNDTLLGTAGKDTLDGGLGADTMTGLGGNDVYYVDNALDQVIEQAGGGMDAVYASASYTLGAQVERLVLTGSAALNGTGNELNNVLIGNAGTNILNGGSGHDSLNGGTGSDALIGGEGNDTLNVSQSTGGSVDGGLGTDTLVMDRSSATTSLSWSLPNTSTTTINGVSVTGVERCVLATGSGNDAIGSNSYSLNVTSDDIRTNAGNDTIWAGDGSDSVSAGAGNDFISLATFHYAGSNSLYADSDWANAGTGDDTIYDVGGLDTVDGGDGYDFAHVFLLSSNVSINLSGNTAWLWNATGSASGNTRVDANSDWASVNNLATTGKHFQFVNTDASTGVDLYNVERLGATGTSANDLIFALSMATGTTSYSGGSGTDTFFANWSNTTTAIRWTNSLYSTVLVGNGSSASIASVERLLLSTGSGDDSISNTNYATNDDIRTNAGNDTIYAGDGSDSVSAGAGNDFISLATFHYAGSNSLYADSDWANAGAGDDMIYGVGGPDTVDGGDGYDFAHVFLLSSKTTINLSGNTAWLWNATGSTSGNTRVDANSDWASVNNLATTGKHFQFVNTDASTGVDLYNVESLGATGTSANDLIFALGTATNPTTYSGGSGIDTFFANWSSTTTAIRWSNSIDSTMFWFGTGSSSVGVFGMERLLLSTGSGNDSISNTNYATNDDIRTNAGNDTIYAGDGSDSVSAGAGNDFISLATFHYAGSNSLYADSDWANAGAGDDMIYGVGGPDTVDGGDGYDFAHVFLLSSKTTINLSGNTAWLWNATGSTSGNTRVDANSDWASVNNLATTGKHFQFVNTDASTGVDLYNVESLGATGTSANDLIFALGTATNPTSYSGGSGTDTFFANWSGTTTAIRWSNSIDSTMLSLGSGSYASVSGMERLLLSTGSGNDSISNTNYATNDDIRTNAGNDTIDGGGGHDSIDAGAGNDLLVGGLGNDLLIGGSGNDSIVSDASSQDRIVLTSLEGNDTISGFQSGSDVIVLRQNAFSIGDGDAVIDGGIVISDPNGDGFDASAELVILATDLGELSTTSVAALIGSANTDYLTGQQAMFAVDNGASSQLYLFTSAGNDATVSASELTLLATLTGTASTAVGDYAFSL
jgi:Ca2+-binding RTX toxin-like protein